VLDARRCPHYLYVMLKRTVLLLAVVCGLAVPSAGAEDRNILAPFRFQSPDGDLDAMERERAIIYRNQLQEQQRALDQAQSTGALDPLERRLQLETRSELERMNDLIRTPRSPSLKLPDSGSLPSLRQQIVPRNSP
jgi:hypothetical protein